MLDHLLWRFCENEREKFRKIAQENQGQLYEYDNEQLKNSEDHTIRGKLIDGYF